MERTAGSDERLDDLSTRMDAGFAPVDADIRELRRAVLDQGVELRGEIAALRVTMIRVGGPMVGAMLAGFLGVVAAVLAGG
jgi:hypothetical protein